MLNILPLLTLHKICERVVQGCYLAVTVESQVQHPGHYTARPHLLCTDSYKFVVHIMRSMSAVK